MTLDLLVLKAVMQNWVCISLPLAACASAFILFCSASKLAMPMRTA